MKLLYNKTGLLSNRNMKVHYKILTLCFLFSCIIVSSCRKEDMELIETPADETLISNSSVAILMQNVSSNDGSVDNIIDKSNCFSIKFPLNVTVNGENILVNSSEAYNIVEYIFDDEDDDVDVLEITYPITIVSEDFSEIVINNDTELNSYSINCNGENEFDDDIECLDFKYPITTSTFNKENEAIETASITSDYELNQFLKNLTQNLITTINFPIDVTLSDGTELMLNNLIELENSINNYKNDCDEDDDFDYNDDDCDSCNVEELTQTLTNCDGWLVDQLDRDNTNYDNAYNGYRFNFSTDGSLGVYWGNTSAYGTWIATGSHNNINVTINIPGLPLCNNVWRLHEMSEYTNKRVDFRVGNSDRLRYNNICD